ncbi:unnamed protein product [Penicillium glandicola]
MDAYKEVFSVGTKFDKQRRFYDHPLGEGSHFNMVDLKSSKARRDMFAPFLSKAAVTRGDPLIQATIMKFIDILREYSKDNRVLDLTRGYHSLTTELILKYGWQRESKFIIGLTLKFPTLAKWNAMSTAVFDLRTQAKDLVLDVMNRPNSPGQKHPTIFDLVLQPDAKTGQPPLSLNDLTTETLIFITGGEESTANTLIHGTFHVLSNPQIKSRLQEELSGAIPDGHPMPTADTLEKLPYLVRK